MTLGLFAAILTALTIVLTFTVDTNARWPSLRAVASEGLLEVWFGVSITSVGLAAFVPQDDGNALADGSMALALWGAVLGTYGIVRVLQISSGAARRAYLAKQLRDAVWHEHRKTDSAQAPHDTIGIYLDAFERGLDSNDVPAVRERVAELLDAASDAQDAAETAIQLELTVLETLVRSLLRGRTDASVIGAGVIPEIAASVTRHVGARAGTAASPAIYLGQTSRLLAWMSSAAYALALRDGAETRSLRGAMAGASKARREILVAVDPDPPGRYIPDDDPWKHGMTDPVEAVLWWWAFCEFNGAHDGSAFYAVAEILTGEKFYGTFGWGNRFVLSAIDDRLEAPDLPADGPAAKSKRFFDTVGGFKFATLELFATSLATWRDRRFPVPDGLEQNWSYWQDPQRLARRARLYCLREPQFATAEEALHAVARLTGPWSQHSGLSGFVTARYAALGSNVLPPMVPVAHRPGACVLATALRLAPLDEHSPDGELADFLTALPNRLLAAAHALATEVFADAVEVVTTDPLASRDRQLTELWDLLRFVHLDAQIAS